MLAGLLSVCAFAKEPDMKFSVKGAKGKPGDTVDVTVAVDQNVGTWAMRFQVVFDKTALKLKDVKNGTVYKDSDFAKASLTNDGYYVYYAEMSSPTENNTNTGDLVTLTFEITERATNGYHDVWLTFPDNGQGWFFDAKDLSKDRSVPADGEVRGTVTVVGSEATSELATDDKGVIADKETKPPVTAYVTDDEGEFVVNDKGEKETYVISSGKKEDAPQYVTDADGNFVKGDDGSYETFYEDEKGNIIDKNAETTDKSSDKSEKDDTSLHKILIIVAVVCVVVAAVIIVIVVTGTNKKNRTENTDNKEDE